LHKTPKKEMAIRGVYMGKKLLTAEQLAKELRDGVDTVVAFEQTKKEKMKLQSQQVRWYRDRNIQAALITAVAMILAAVITSHGNKQSVSLQKNITMSPDAETKGNLSQAVVTSGPNSTVNIFIAPSQSDSNDTIKPSKPTPDTSKSLPNSNPSSPESPIMSLRFGG
jgi:hypothetical protein